MARKLSATYAAIMGSVLARRRKNLRGPGKPEVRQSEIAAQCGISRSSWSRMESGEMLPDVRQVRNIEKYFRLNSGDFMAEVDECCKNLEKEGVEIIEYEEKKEEKKGSAGLLLLGATLATLVGAIAVASKSSDDSKKDETDAK